MKRHAKAPSAASRAATGEGRGLFGSPFASLVAVALVLVASFATAPHASAAQTFAPTGSFSGPGASPGELTNPQDAAVEQSTGNLFIADQGNGRIDVFGPDGSFLTSFGEAALDAPYGVAIRESAGQTQVYVSDPVVGKVLRFNSDEAAVPAFTLDGTYTSPAAGAGATQVGDFAAPLALAPNGDLWLADRGDDLLQRFDPTGASVASIDGSSSPGGAFTGLLDVAVDSTGRVYAVDANGFITGQQDGTSANGQSRVARFAADGAHQLTIADLERPATVAVDPATDQVVVSANQDNVDYNGQPSIHVFDSAGAKLHLALSGPTAQYTTVHGLAFASGGSRVWSVNDSGYYGGGPYGQEGIHRFGLVEEPTATIQAPTGVTSTSATFHGLVNPQGDPTDYFFEYSSDGSNWSQTPVQSAGAGSADVAVEAEVTDLQADTFYVIRLVVTKSEGAVRRFSQRITLAGDIATPPVAVATPVTDIGGETATLNGTVEALAGVKTSYRFELSRDGGFNWSPVDPDQDGDEQIVGSGSGPQAVSIVATELEPATEYEVRFITANIGGEDTAEQSFATKAIGPGVGTVRANSASSTSARLAGAVDPNRLPTAYHFEWGVRADLSDAQSLPASEDASAGSGNDWVSVGKDLEGLQPNTTYYFRLIADNGVGAPMQGDIHSFQTYPTPAPEPPYEGAPTPGRGFLPENRGWELVNAPDMGGTAISRAMLAPSTPDRALYSTRGPAPGSQSGLFWSPFVAERTPTGWRARNVVPTRVGARYSWTTFEAYSPDASRLILNGNASQISTLDMLRVEAFAIDDFEVLLPDHALEGFGVYASEDLERVFGRTNEPIAPVIPATQVIEYGAGAPTLVSVLPNGEPPVCASWYVQDRRNRNPVSVDGSRFIFAAVPQGTECGGSFHLYMRIAGPGRDYSSPHASTIRLDAPEAGGSEAGSELVQATPDGSTVFFTTSANLGGDPEEDGGGLYRYDVSSGERTCLTCGLGVRNGEIQEVFVAESGGRAYFRSGRVLAPGAERGAGNLYLLIGGEARFIATQFVETGREVGLTPDGSTIVFPGTGSALDETTGRDAGGFNQVYRYSASRDQLDCLTCPLDEPATSEGQSNADAEVTEARSWHTLSDDGSLVIFMTATSLVDADVNGSDDVYRWREGQPQAALITDGRNPSSGGRTRALEVSADGSTILFVSNAKLTPEVLSDPPVEQLYVARIGGGFPIPNPTAPCAGDACRGGPSAPPAADLPGSSSFSGPGNRTVKPCAKGKSRKKGRCVKPKKRAVKKKGKGKRASAKRGAGR